MILPSVLNRAAALFSTLLLAQLARPNEPPAILFAVDGFVGENDWRAPDWGLPIAEAPGPNPYWSCHWDSRYSPQYRGSFAESIGTSDLSGQLLIEDRLKLIWQNPGGMNFGWPLVKVNHRVLIYARGLNTPVRVIVDHGAVMFNTSQSPNHEWKFGLFPPGAWHFPNQNNQGVFDSEPIIWDTVTIQPEAAVLYQGVLYYPLDVWWETNALPTQITTWIDQNASFGGTHAGETWGFVSIAAYIDAGQAPVTSSAMLPAITSSRKRVFVAIDPHDPDDGPGYGEGIVAYEWQIDGGGFKSGQASLSAFFLPGPHQVDLRVVDNEGMRSTIVSQVFKVR